MCNLHEVRETTGLCKLCKITEERRDGRLIEELVTEEVMYLQKRMNLRAFIKALNALGGSSDAIGDHQVVSKSLKVSAVSMEIKKRMNLRGRLNLQLVQQSAQRLEGLVVKRFL